MALIEKSVIKTEAVFSDDRQYRYQLRKEWDKNKKKAMVIMVSPSYADAILQDQTTMYVVNNLYRLDFGGVDIVNIFPAFDGKPYAEEHVEKENLDFILASAAKAESIIIAWGKAGDTSKAVLKQQENLMKQLEPFKEKMLSIGLHPLAPRMRAQWQLKKFSTAAGQSA